MKNYWIIGILGLIVIVLNFLGFPIAVKTGIFLAVGLAISFLAFREIIRKKLENDFEENDIAPMGGQTELSGGREESDNLNQNNSRG